VRIITLTGLAAGAIAVFAPEQRSNAPVRGKGAGERISSSGSGTAKVRPERA
jgi:hypothetical protein